MTTQGEDSPSPNEVSPENAKGRQRRTPRVKSRYKLRARAGSGIGNDTATANVGFEDSLEFTNAERRKSGESTPSQQNLQEQHHQSFSSSKQSSALHSSSTPLSTFSSAARSILSGPSALFARLTGQDNGEDSDGDPGDDAPYVYACEGASDVSSVTYMVDFDDMSISSETLIESKKKFVKDQFNEWKHASKEAKKYSQKQKKQSSNLHSTSTDISSFANTAMDFLTSDDDAMPKVGKSATEVIQEEEEEGDGDESEEEVSDAIKSSDHRESEEETGDDAKSSGRLESTLTDGGEGSTAANASHGDANANQSDGTSLSLLYGTRIDSSASDEIAKSETIEKSTSVVLTVGEDAPDANSVSLESRTSVGSRSQQGKDSSSFQINSKAAKIKEGTEKAAMAVSTSGDSSVADTTYSTLTTSYANTRRTGISTTMLAIIGIVTGLIVAGAIATTLAVLEPFSVDQFITTPLPPPTISPAPSHSTVPSTKPSILPSTGPSAFPSPLYSARPSSFPSTGPSPSPSIGPSQLPSAEPSSLPSFAPSLSPTKISSSLPSTSVRGSANPPLPNPNLGVPNGLPNPNLGVPNVLPTPTTASCHENYNVELGSFTIFLSDFTRLVTDLEKFFIEQTFEGIYNERAGGCDKPYERFVQNASIIEQMLVNEDEYQTLKMKWEVEVRCRDCGLLEEVLFSEDVDKVTEEVATVVPQAVLIGTRGDSAHHLSTRSFETYGGQSGEDDHSHHGKSESHRHDGGQGGTHDFLPHRRLGRSREEIFRDVMGMVLYALHEAFGANGPVDGTKNSITVTRATLQNTEGVTIETFTNILGANPELLHVPEGQSVPQFVPSANPTLSGSGEPSASPTNASKPSHIVLPSQTISPTLLLSSTSSPTKLKSPEVPLAAPAEESLSPGLVPTRFSSPEPTSPPSSPPSSSPSSQPTLFAATPSKLSGDTPTSLSVSSDVSPTADHVETSTPSMSDSSAAPIVPEDATPPVAPDVLVEVRNRN